MMRLAVSLICAGWLPHDRVGVGSGPLVERRLPVLVIEPWTRWVPLEGSLGTSPRKPPMVAQ